MNKRTDGGVSFSWPQAIASIRMAMPVNPRTKPLNAVKTPADSCENQSPFIATDSTALAASSTMYNVCPRSPSMDRKVDGRCRGRVTQIHHTNVVRPRNPDTVRAAVHAASPEYDCSSGVGYISGKAYVSRNEDVKSGKTGSPGTRCEHQR